MGNLVGARGHSPHVNAGVMADLRELSRAAAILEQRADPDAGGGAGCVWRAGCTTGLPVDMVLPDAAPAAGDRRRRIDGSADAACASVQLGSIFVVWISRVLVALPVRVVEARS